MAAIAQKQDNNDFFFLYRGKCAHWAQVSMQMLLSIKQTSRAACESWKKNQMAPIFSQLQTNFQSGT